MSDTGPLLEVEQLKVHFPIRAGVARRSTSVVHAVDGVSFRVMRGTAFGLVGESGSGKTTTALACVRLIDPTAGRIGLNGRDITGLSGEELRLARRNMQIVFQDPYSSLNPRERVSAIVRRPLDLMNVGSPEGRDGRVQELLRLVGLRPEQQALFPHQFSGGQRQRIGIARALATNLDLIVCDEPVSALDLAIQAQILNLLMKLKRELSLTYLFISHDLGVVQHVCDEVAVMYLGKIVERGSIKRIFSNPAHPYTVALLSAVPSLEPGGVNAPARVRLQGEPPNPIDLPSGCRFAARCPAAAERCRREEPPLRDIDGQHSVACHRVSASGTKEWV